MFVLVSHELRIVDFVFDRSIEHERYGNFSGFDLFQDFEIILRNKFLEFNDKFEGFVTDAFQIELSGSEEVLQVKTDIFNVADEVLSHDLLCVHLFSIDGYWIIRNGNSKQKIVKLLIMTVFLCNYCFWYYFLCIYSF